MSLNTFIPALWAGQLLSNLDKALVYGNIVNRDYEGEIADHGDTVKIHSIGRVTITDYTKNTDLADPETLTDAERSLVINKAKAFNFQVDDIDQAQQNPKVMGEAMKEAAYALANVADGLIAAEYANADSGNAVGSTGTPVAITASNAYTHLLQLSLKLTKANIPRERRFAVVPPEFTACVLDDSRFVGFGTDPNLQRFQNGVPDNGYVGRIAGFDLYESNNVPAPSSVSKILAGHPMAISFADQIVKVEPYRMEKRFADALKGLHVYGIKTVRPTALGVGSVTFS